MDPILRAAAIYVALLLIFRISGKRTLSQITTFDFVLLLVVGEATQQAMLGDDFSVTNGILVVVALVGIDIAMSFVKEKVSWFDRAADSLPVVIFQDGNPIKERMQKARVDEDDILAAGQASQGLERMDQIKYAVLEQGGSISVIPHS